jgi:bifunctional non-homologous end joining protein LigD
VFVEPELVAEIEFREWTEDGVMRAPSFKGLREDKPAEQVGREGDASPAAAGEAGARTVRAGGGGAAANHDSPDALFDHAERLTDDAISVLVDGRELRISNWDKVLFPRTGFTKGDLIAYYTRIAPAVLPHLHDRPLTLKRYPNGVERPYFYEKQSPSHRPEWVQTARVGDVEYTLAQDRPTLVWLANLADVELHTSLSLVPGGQRLASPSRAPAAQRRASRSQAAAPRPTMLVFDLDPGAPATLIQCCEVGLVLHGLFDQLGLESFAKTSGSKGLQVYVPLNVAVTYEQTKPLAKRIAELLEQRLPELVVSRMTKRLRAGRVLVDWSQNDAHKTTVNVYSVRARERPTVSTPVSWEEVARCREQDDESVLTFEVDDVLARVEERGDLFAPIVSRRQELPALG